eukprot:751901-Hanusia_phi.AAC.1
MQTSATQSVPPPPPPLPPLPLPTHSTVPDHAPAPTLLHQLLSPPLLLLSPRSWRQGGGSLGSRRANI